MDRNVAWYIEKQVERTIKNLNRRNMEGHYIDNIDQLFEKLKEFIADGSIVGVGDSMTLFEAGVIDFLRSGNFNFLDKYQDKLTKDKKERYILRIFLQIHLFVVLMQ
ncbi:transcriptional regulators of sugar metabolism [Clostridium sporogenes]|nr:transcriptional regulators of sugar metabolism [Clostridium sporogenes]